MKTNRYTLKKVAALTAVFYVLLLVLQFSAVMLMPEKEKELKKLHSLKTLYTGVLVYAFMVFFFYVFVNRFYHIVTGRKPFLRHYLPMILLAVLVYSTYQGIAIYFTPESVNRPEFTVGLLIFSVAVTSLVMTCLALLIAYLTSLRDEQKQRKILEKQKMELEVQNSQANFNFLKAQINPHFLHNTLNFFYAKALPLSAELSEGILCLSDIMRYALNEGGKDEKALLDDEIAHLENLVKINQFRFSNKLNLQIEITGNTSGAMIVPFVLITLVENAFKHGDLKNSQHPIIIRVAVNDKRLDFYCRNKKNPGSKEISTGIGLQNIKKRLDIMYGANYRYHVTDEPEFYTVELTIDPL
ncbi:MAG: hypothetical protein JWQ78_1056 [Sediminibacterium sp.]|nr:hypothetical protein [Sediminibacterium sp.]